MHALSSLHLTNIKPLGGLISLFFNIKFNLSQTNTLRKYMKCPVCNDESLVMSDRQGVEIDYCPKCRGVWLDRGELDKIIERSTSEFEPVRDQKYSKDQSKHVEGHGHHKKRKSLLSEIFDF